MWNKWNGRRKAVTFSYDDGVIFDERLVGLFNKYGMKCTFNLNSGIQTYANAWNNSGVSVHRMNVAGLPELYRGHEIASHCLTHEDLTKLDRATMYNEIHEDKMNLERIYGQEVVGFAYPFGTYNDEAVEVLRECGIKYARTVWNMDNLMTVPEDLLRLRPGFHHSCETLTEKAKEFVLMEPDEPVMLYIWGHSYEFEVDGTWDYFENILQILSGHDDIFYGTNRQVLLGE